MHELALARQIARIAEESLAPGELPRLRAIHLRLGALACVAEEALRFAFAASLPEVRLEIAREPGEAWCEGCAAAVPLAARGEPCPSCGGYALRVRSGDALRVVGLELEEPAA